MLRIDYVWHNDHFVARKVTVWGTSGSSDHHPVIATLHLKGEPIHS